LITIYDWLAIPGSVTFVSEIFVAAIKIKGNIPKLKTS